MTSKQSPETITRRVLAHFGGPANLARVAAGSGMKGPPGVERVKKWGQRGNIPTVWLCKLETLGQKVGKPLNLMSNTTTKRIPE